MCYDRIVACLKMYGNLLCMLYNLNCFPNADMLLAGRFSDSTRVKFVSLKLVLVTSFIL